jgi:hypothetical protein
VDLGEKGGRAWGGGSKREVVVRGKERRLDGGVVAPEQVVQLVEVGDEDRDQAAVGRRSVAVQEAVEVAEVGVVGEQDLLGRDERGGEEGESCELRGGA